ncbi:hypothetical protein GYMLUDRAFT_310254 [Collybiopsis luxurians FD-317 M1]|nr:hypothetical protein GYMLUDRAFT_310254 [Collybiopsis luxurians FD-317 M1]
MPSFSHLSLLVLSFSSFILNAHASSHGNLWLNHRSKNTSLKARDTSGVFTWYVAGLGACGTVNSASDYVSSICCRLKTVNLCSSSVSRLSR